MKNEPLNDWYKETFETLSEEPPIDVWQGIEAGVQDTPEVEETPVVTLDQSKKGRVWLRVAAVLSILLVGTFVALTVFKDAPVQPETNSQFLSYADLVSQFAGQGFSENKNLENIDIFYLADGTLVFLNKDSRLTFPTTFGENERVVVLEGEAFFDVARDEEHPFVIYSENTRTEVLGTSFNLKAYDKQEEVELTVVTGEVQLSIIGTKGGNSSLNLVPSERGVFEKKEATLSEHKVEGADFIEWAHDQEQIAQTALYKQEAETPSEYVDMASEWEQNSVNETVLGGEIKNSSALLVFDKVMLKATYTSSSGEKLASKFFEIKEEVLPGQTINYEHVMRDWIEGTENITVTLENIELK